MPKLYRELAPWWPLISPSSEYEEEAQIFAGLLERHARRPLRHVLELGSGGGHNASHMKGRFAMTLVDASAGMLEVSRALNPDCEHVRGDMRKVRLGRRFDAVFVHDAVMHMTTERDLLATIRTAAVHLEPGGVALFAPDDTAETYRPKTSWGGADGDGRSARYLEWARPRATGSSTIAVTYVFVLEQRGRRPLVEHDEMRFGLFPRTRWVSLLRRTGLRARAVRYPSTFARAPTGLAFVGIKPERRSRARRR